MSNSRLVEGPHWTGRVLYPAIVVFAVWFWLLPQELLACECGGSDINSMRQHVDAHLPSLRDELNRWKSSHGPTLSWIWDPTGW